MSEIRWHTTSYYEMVGEPALMMEMLGRSAKDVREVRTNSGLFASSWDEYTAFYDRVEDTISLVRNNFSLMIVGDDWAIRGSFHEGETRYECWEGCTFKTIDVKGSVSSDAAVFIIKGGDRMIVTIRRYKTEAGDADE